MAEDMSVEMPDDGTSLPDVAAMPADDEPGPDAAPPPAGEPKPPAPRRTPSKATGTRTPARTTARQAAGVKKTGASPGRSTPAKPRSPTATGEAQGEAGAPEPVTDGPPTPTATPRRRPSGRAVPTDEDSDASVAGDDAVASPAPPSVDASVVPVAASGDEAVAPEVRTASVRTRSGVVLGWVRSHRSVVGVGVVAVALAIALALALVALGNQDALGAARPSALAAARTDAVELAGYDYRHLDHDFGVVLANSTPSFRRSFTQSSDALKTTLTRYHATADAKVVSAGLVSATTSRAVALVLVDQTITNSTQKAPTTDRSQVEITLVNSGGAWLIDQVSLL